MAWLFLHPRSSLCKFYLDDPRNVEYGCWVTSKVSDGGAANWLRDFVSRGGQKKSDGECLLKAASKMDELSFEIERLDKAQDEIKDARDGLYVAYVQSLPSDDAIIMGHVLNALHRLDKVLGGEYPKMTADLLDRRSKVAP